VQHRDHNYIQHMKRWNAIQMNDGVSLQRIKSYLQRWAQWWTRTSDGTWHYIELLQYFIDVCFDENIADIAAKLLQATFKYNGALVLRAWLQQPSMVDSLPQHVKARFGIF
jgi:hypothetical protein